ncbi:MAG: hypothetical protein R2724_06780 [Bryobacterales bacterium]
MPFRVGLIDEDAGGELEAGDARHAGAISMRQWKPSGAAKGAV